MPTEDANKPVTLQSAFEAVRAELERLPDAIEAAPKGQGVDLTALNDAVETADRAARDEVRTQQDALAAKQGELQTAQTRADELAQAAPDSLGRDEMGYPFGYLDGARAGMAPGNAPPELATSPSGSAGHIRAEAPDPSTLRDEQPADQAGDGGNDTVLATAGTREGKSDQDGAS